MENQKGIEAEEKRLAKVGWLHLSSQERKEVREKANSDWDKLKDFMKNKISSKDEFINYSIRMDCIKVSNRLGWNKLTPKGDKKS